MPSFTKLNLDQRILNALEKKGYTTPTPIQFQAIPHILEGKDILGIAQTGTGKTAAFSLPILDNLTKSNNRVKPNQIRVLILTPTRELASQIAENISGYGKELGFRHAVIFGGVAINPQIKTMSQGLDILIATPGRLLDLMNQGHVRYSNLEIFVLDEADRMLDMGFIHDVKKIIKKLPEKRQTLFFSATMPEAIAELADSILTNPAKIEVTPQATTVDRIDQRINLVAKGNKQLLLKKILKQEDVESVLVFSKTKHGANRIVQYLESESIKVAAIHGNKSQAAREKALSGFRAGSIKVLVATDIAARGIDVPGISHVINYDIPNDPESYVHRIGRTARAGKEGIAISFCDPSEKSLLRAVEKLIKFQIPVDESHPLHGVESSTPYVKADPRHTNVNNRNKSAARAESTREANERNRSSRPDTARSRDDRAKFTKRDDGRDDRRDDRNFNSRSEEDLDLKFNQEKSNVNREAFSGYKPKFGANGKRFNKDSSRFSSGKSSGGFSGDSSRPRFGEGRSDGARSDRGGFGENSRPRFSSAAGGRSEGVRSDRGGFGENSRPRFSSANGGRSEGGRSENRPSRFDNTPVADTYVSNKDGRRTDRAAPSGKGKNFSYAGVRERKIGGAKKKPFGKSWKS